MTHTAFFDLARQTAHAALNGSQQPALGGKLLTHLKIIAKCFVGDAVVTVDTGTAEFLILAKTSASGAASLIDTTAVLNTSDPDEPQYEFEWNPADSIQLRAVLDAAADPTTPVELRYEFRFERSGQKGCIGGPIWFLNNFFRPETPAPLATQDSAWELLKATFAAGDNVNRTVNETTKVITFAVPDFADGREIELQASGTHIQWRYVGVGSWTNLVALSVITGPAGANGANGSNGTNGTNGSSVELQVTGTHIQWRLVGAPTWTNLVALATITGPAGSNGTNGTNGAAGDDGREIELQTTATHVQWRYVGAGSWTNLVALTAITGPAGSNGTNGTNGTNGSAGADGDDGREIELQTTATHVQWRYVGAGSWTNIIALTAITGPAGSNGTNGTNGTNGSAGADGDDGREIELQTTSTHIQWRYIGAGSWTNLVALTAITGPAGAEGPPGGGGGVIDPLIAYVRETGGSDTTGDGSAGAPFATAQKAVDEGFNIINAQGEVGGITEASALSFWLIGHGKERTNFGTIELAGGHVYGNGRDMLSVAAVTFRPPTVGAGANGDTTGANGVDGPIGTTATDSSVRGLTVTNGISLIGGTGARGGNGAAGDSDTITGGSGGMGGTGGAGAVLTIEDCAYDTASSKGGNGGDGGDGGNDADYPGSGGVGGSAASGGNLIIINSVELTDHNTGPGDGGIGGSHGFGGNAPNGGAGGNGATTIKRFSDVRTGSDTTNTVTASVVDGTFVASA